jgi:hypothetical protein
MCPEYSLEGGLGTRVFSMASLRKGGWRSAGKGGGRRFAGGTEEPAAIAGVEISNIHVHSDRLFRSSDLADRIANRLDCDDKQTAYSSGGTVRR